MNDFFDNVEEMYRKLKILEYSDCACRIWNCDESGICTAVVSQQILAKRGSRWVHETGGGFGQETITVHACGQLVGTGSLLTLFIKGSIYTPHGHAMALMVQCTVPAHLDGWRRSISFRG